MATNTLLGSIKWFNHKRGYGFLKDCDSGADIFVHYTAIRVPDGVYKTLIDGEYVQYELSSETNDGKPIALNVTGVKGGPLLCQLENKRVQVIYTGNNTEKGNTRPRGRRGGKRGRVSTERKSEESSPSNNRYESLEEATENEVDV